MARRLAALPGINIMEFKERSRTIGQVEKGSRGEPTG